MSETTAKTVKPRVPKPKWLRVKLPTGEEYKKVREIVSEHKLHTICESGHYITFASVLFTRLYFKLVQYYF